MMARYHIRMTGLGSVIVALERQLAAIDKAIRALREVRGVSAPAATIPSSIETSAPTGRRGRKRTPEQRKRMSEGQRRRHQTKSESETVPAPGVTKSSVTDAGRKKLALAMKKRWAVKRAAAATKKAPKKGRKKVAVG